MSPTEHTAAAPSADAVFAEFSRLLDTGGARQALAHVLEQSDYRFIGVFKFHAGRARAVIHYDRESPSVVAIGDVPESATYCCYVRDTAGVFTTVNAMEDARLTQHPAREAVLSYCGIPVMDPEGALLGTLCHYDVVPRDAKQLDFELLIRVSSALERGGHIPAY